MGVTIRKKGDKWYVFVNYQGKRKAKCVGTRAAAEQVRRTLEAKLALGDFGFVAVNEDEVPTFKDYAQHWLETHPKTDCKPSTYRSYEQLLTVHVYPWFGTKKLDGIKRENIKGFLGELARAKRAVDEDGGETELPYSRNTLRLIVCALRSVLNSAVEDEIIESNPATRVGKFAKNDKPAQKASAMSRSETQQFLDTIVELYPDWHPFFLTSVRTGLRKGELIALKWGDIQFGSSEEDSNRYILVQRNFSLGDFTTPKNGKSRRVDLSRQLRKVFARRKG